MRESWRSYLLMASLAGNVFAAGAGVGGVLSREDPKPPPRASGGDFLTDAPPRLFRELSRRDRLQLRRELGPILQEGRVLRGELRAAWLRAAEALRAEPFDPEAFRAAVRDALQAQTELRATGAGALSEIMVRLPAERRAELADLMTGRGRDGNGAGRRRTLPRRPGDPEG